MENKIQANEKSFAALGGQYDRKARLDRLFARANGSEDISRREESTKYFDLGNNRHQAIVYGEPVHFRDPISGKWEDIDNTLEEFVTEQGRRVLRNHAGRMHVEFPRHADGGSMVSITEDGKTFSWRFEHEVQTVDANPRTGVQLKQERLLKLAQRMPKFVGRTVESLRAADLSAEMESEQERRTDLPKLRSENRYDQILPGVSVRYLLSGSQIKEDIIVDSADALVNTAIRLPNEFAYEVSAKNELIVKDARNGNLLFTMDTPIIYDAEDAHCSGGIVLTPCSGYTRLEYAIDADFLRDAAFPITIDPVIKTKDSNSTINDTTLSSTSSSNNASDELIRCGTYSNVEYASFLRFQKIPELDASATVVSAEIQLKEKASTTNRCIAAYEIQRKWCPMNSSDTFTGTVNWTAFNPYDTANVSDEILDCINGLGYANADLKFDVTNLFRKYYSGEKTYKDQHFGIAFHTPANYNAGGVTDTNYSTMYSSDKSGDYYRPKLCINYISHAGLESWWHYEQMSAGRAGTVYADIFNGNVVLEHADTSMTGSRMPVSVTHYYNSCLCGNNDFFCGNGWKTNLHQYIKEVTLNSTTYFVWMDGDGTEHYFKKSGSTHTFYDDEGMGLKLNYSYDNSSPANYIFTLTDKGHNKSTFTGPTTGKAWITKTVDSCGNTVTYTFDSTQQGKILSVKDGSGRITSFTYENDLIKTITTPDVDSTTRTVAFAYNSNRLTSITYSDLSAYTAPHTVYTYDGTTNLIKSAKNYDDAQVNVEFYIVNLAADSSDADAQKAEYRRAKSLEYVNGTARGAKQLFSYKDMCTEVTAVEASASGATDGKKLFYQFNDSGNIVCVRDELGYAYFTKYESGIENKASAQSPLRKAVVNLLRNPDLVNKNSDTVWTASGSNVAQDTSLSCLNTRPIKITSAAAAAGYYRQMVTLEKGKRYVLSAFVKTSNVTASGNAIGAYVALTPVSSASGSAVKSIPMIGSTGDSVGNELPMDGWERVHVNLDLTSAGSGTVSYYADLCLYGGGTAWFACPQLEEGSILSPVNLVSNGDFRYYDTINADSAPKDWTANTNNLTTAATGVCSRNSDMPAALSGNFVQVEGRPNKDKVGFQQVIEVAGSMDDIFVIGGWVNALSVPNANTDTRHCALTVELRKSDGTYTDPTVFSFNSEHVGWQFGCWAISATRDYKAIRLSVSYSKNCCTAQFSNIFLHREQFGESFIYDENENITSASTLAGQKTHIKYDNADNVRRYVQPGLDDGVDSNYFRMSYGDTQAEQEKHLMLSHRTPEGVTQRCDYDSYGNCIANLNVDVADIDAKLTSLSKGFIRSETAYDVNGNYPISAKDARGYTVSKDVDANTGLVKSVTDPNQQKVNYTYDSAKRVTEVSTTADSKTYKNTYTYDHDRIKTVAHNTDTNNPDVTYTFGYDSLGRKTTVKVGSQTLSTNKYKDGSRSSLIESVTYGNGGKVSYTYDDFDRMKSVKYDSEGSARYSYDYGCNGQAAEIRDSNLHCITRTDYDLIDRPCKVEITDDSTNENLLYRTQLKYDKRSNLKTFFEKLPSRDYSTDYTYDRDNRITNLNYHYSSATSAPEAKVDYTFNAVGGLNSRTARVGSNAYATTYGYVSGGYTSKSGATTSVTPLVSTITQTGMNFAYTYDNRGNIVSETRNGVVTTYAYDALGQLIRANDPHDTTAGSTGTTWVYEYDRGGNIKQKTYYAYTTSTPTGGTAISYGYDTVWKDKLTSYNGKAITYDAIGNPQTYDGWTYTWQAGRQLAKMQKTGMTVEFKYNHSGLRTQKKVTENGVTTTTDYTLHGKLITHLTKGNETLHFFYDAQSKPAMVEYNGTVYRYVHNLQGDIVGILDSAGTLVVEYKYDAWGEPLSVTGTLADTLGKRNPFRYRGYVYDEEIGLYYLRSRYYNPTVGRFVNADGRAGRRGDILSHNVYCYCDNKPILCVDLNGTGKAYVFYYYFPESSSPLKEEAMNSPYFDSSDETSVAMIPVKTAEDFVNAWNAMEGEIDDVYLYLHGAPGHLQLAEDRIGVDDESEYSFDALDEKIISGTVYDFACYGAAKSGGKTVAGALAKKTQATVIACDVGVSYRFDQKWLGKIFGNTWHARTRTKSMLRPHWYRFTYNKAKQTAIKMKLHIWRVMEGRIY